MTSTESRPAHVAIIGAGIAGLAAALRLSAAGHAVTVIEAQPGPGGKMRALPSAAGPVDAGPTVLTMRPVFEDLFAAAGERLQDHLTLTPLPILARHFWDDGATLDLMADRDASAANIAAAFGPRAAREFTDFAARAARLFDAFDAPMMQSPAPSQTALAMTVAARPGLIRDMAPWASLGAMLDGAFSDPHLAQLFGRYATYVGGSPYASPALLSLIAEAEARGVWAIKGGMHRLARTLEQLARDRGAAFLYATRAQRIEMRDGRAAGVTTTNGRVPADAVLFNGDPRALHRGLLGEAVTQAVPSSAVGPRSLSAWVHAFAATPSGPDLAYHTVFFGHDPRAEFDALARGQRPRDATLYICAQDRAGPARPTGPERFEIILNGAPTGPRTAARPETERDIAQCQTQVFDRLAAFGLSFDPRPGPMSLTSPEGFARLFPASTGSLYGRSPHGLTAGLKRPTARTPVPGLYLCGGGAHPGAGVPMATLSARHAADAIMADQTSPSPSRRTAMRGGISTGSAPAAHARSRSSPS
ncbi:1-hydroxycarotenoid 3,4-desaturase CrtD [Flavimaricola marinus]|uniref:Hydroxyneurosporene desaturase n=1 Tax=Flavimaricola marinus TaxID=1819565 RepID=A0A238LBR5_9RHOB|nr:1-hydroxycarotenoid 3,4-desaturase CrtD [Flavimaricola marinus]SMY07078.1 Hydroxyneurosporene desaturase [Flavimaricola marinus]